MTAALSEKLRKYLDESRVFATVATVMPDGRPHLTVVWIKRDGDDLVFSTTADRLQGRNIARDARVTVLVNPPDDPYVYAEVRGTATITPDPGADLVNELSLKYTGQDYATFNPASKDDGERIIVRVTPERVTGRL
ncbi:TIGR03618 family F420-dependent PPOX class oxidoreductase [Streptomyces sp. TRM43335]|uniref:TIGR03618 family F420-dependent PPOX class oxidoreductase n=1 Tax=Streptomyces taklimakanensis TaxID=2569853 RepID=A0A6G2BBZ0_9ACTN|nr:PPOX class F420-dependent oxidoreductase [Streptomyces taklimakanensis]MTE19778.1 TIGR03618 family F420-dependent PPOX class oxidoreductase [Streptomyces taklimakanensis]